MTRVVARHGASHGVQARDGGVQDLATSARSKPVAESHQRCNVQRRNRSHRRNQIRRLIHVVTYFPAYLGGGLVKLLWRVGAETEGKKMMLTISKRVPAGQETVERFAPRTDKLSATREADKERGR